MGSTEGTSLFFLLHKSACQHMLSNLASKESACFYVEVKPQL